MIIGRVCNRKGQANCHVNALWLNRNMQQAVPIEQVRRCVPSNPLPSFADVLVVSIQKRVKEFGFLFLALLLFRGRAIAQEETVRPHLLLILCDALTLDDLRNDAYPHLAHFAENAAIGLMNCGVTGSKTSIAAILTLAAGQHIPAEPTDAQTAEWWEAVPGDQGNALAVYTRRTHLPSLQNAIDAQFKKSPFPLATEGTEGEPRKTSALAPLSLAGRGARGEGRNRSIYHLGLASLARRGLDTARLGAALAATAEPIRAFVCGNADADTPNRAAALLTLDAKGAGSGLISSLRHKPASPFGLADDPIQLSQIATEYPADLMVIQMGDTARAEAAHPHLTPAAYRKARGDALRRLNILVYLLTLQERQDGNAADILLVSPRPPADSAARPEAWGRLTPLLAAGPHFAPGLLTSATTRTAGLVANTDMAPTLLSLFRAPIPLTMEGRPMRVLSGSPGGPERVAAVARLDYLTTLNDRTLKQAMPFLVTACLLVGLAGVTVRRRWGVRVARRFAPALIVVQNLPAALLLAPILVPPTLFEYVLRILAWMVGLALLSYLAARLLRLSPTVAAALITILLATGDLLTGQALLKDSLLSGYPLSGIRYYGIGNEYLGIVLGLALAASFATLDDREKQQTTVNTADTEKNREKTQPQKDTEAHGKSEDNLAADGRGYTWIQNGNDVTVSQPLSVAAVFALVWIVLAAVFGWPGLGANAGSLVATGAGFGVGIALLRGRRPTFLFGLLCALGGLGLAFAFGALEAWLAGRNGMTAGASSHLGAAMQAASDERGPGYLAQIALRKVAMNVRLLTTPWFLAAAAGVALVVVAMRALLGAALQTLLALRVWTRRGLTATLAAILASLVFKDSGVVTVAFLVGAQCAILLYYALTEEEGESRA